ncbi:MAG: hypothetical protein HC911_13790 [Chloroflexaceae bacterium]|nr:hypothetical protein [Chloroflexaceae bacterium]
MQPPTPWKAITVIQVVSWPLAGFLASQQHFLSAAVVVGLNLLSSLVVGIAGDVAEGLRKAWAPQITAWLASAPSKLWAWGRRRSDPVGKRYYEWWQSERERINTFGLQGIPEKPKVRDIFVDLKIARGQADSKLVAERLQGATSIWDFIRASVDAVAQKQIGNNRVWVVLGAAGYGKTTLMQHVALELIASNHRRYRLPPRVPVLLYLREYRAQFEQDSIPHLGKLLATILQIHPSSRMKTGLKSNSRRVRVLCC